MKREIKIDILLCFLFTIFILMSITFLFFKNAYSMGIKSALENKENITKKKYQKKYFAFEYHQSSKLSYLNILTSWKPDWFNKPDVSKIYPAAKKISLEKHLESWKGLNLGKAIKLSIEAESFSPSEPLSLNDLSRLLYFTYGVSGVIKTLDGPLYLRTAPSAGALYPTEIYLVVSNVKDLENGIYNYLAKEHILQLVKKGDFIKDLRACCLDDNIGTKSNLIFILTDIFYRSKWKYHERGYRYSLIDTGYVIANLTLEATSMGLSAKAYIDFSDDKVNELLGLDGIKEASVALVAVGRNSEEGDKNVPPIDRRGFLTPQEGKEDFSIPKIRDDMSISEKYHENSKEIIYKPKTDRVLRKPYNIEKRIELTKKFQDSSNKIEDILLKRRSAKDLSNLPISKTELSEILYFCFELKREIDYKFLNSRLLNLFLIVNNVQGLDRGVYHYDPESHAIEQMKKIDLRGTIWKSCLRQDIVKNASVVFIKVGLIEQAIKVCGDREYRHILLASGKMGENIYLVATKLGLGVRAIGAFFDDELNKLVGIDGHNEAVIHLTIVGRVYIKEQVK